MPLFVCMKPGVEFEQAQKTIINSPLTPNPPPATCLLSAHESHVSGRICYHFLTFPSQPHLCNPHAAPAMPLTPCHSHGQLNALCHPLDPDKPHIFILSPADGAMSPPVQTTNLGSFDFSKIAILKLQIQCGVREQV